MAVEVVRQVWCDLHLKVKKKKVSGLEGRATALAEGKVVSIDLCDECFQTLTYAEILAFGHSDDQPKADPTRLSEKLRKPKQGGKRALVECSICSKQLTAGAGWALHNKVHERDDQKSANPIPVAS